MSDTEADRGDDVPGYEEESNAHQACYVFTPFSADDLEHEKPANKRRKTKHSSNDEQSHFPQLNHGSEPAELARLRYELYKEVWERKQARINSIVEVTDDAALKKIVDFVQHPRTKNEHALRTGLMVSGPDGSAQSRLLGRWQEHRAEDMGTINIQLKASHCSNLQTALRNIIKNTISARVGQNGYQSFLNKHKKLIPMNFDLELLQIFVEQHDIQKIVLSILDVETFDIGILSELLSTLSHWSDKTPFIVLLGIATTVDLFESRLPKYTINILDATIFTLQSSEDVLQQILDDLQQDDEQGITFGPLTISALQEFTQHQGITIEMFTSTIKYAIMSHFFANSLSALLSKSHSFSADKSLCEAIRNTQSLQAYCDDLLRTGKASARTEVSQLLTNDEALQKASIIAAQSTPSSTTTSAQKTKTPKFLLPEASTINTRTLLHPFTPRPRQAIERALSKPSDYLGCSCCHDPSSSPSAPPTSTLYTLLQEAGTVINVRDLYDAFCARQFQSSIPDDGEPDTGDKADRSQMACFYTALAELRMLGLVKGSSSAGLKKKAAGAGAGSDGNVFAKGRDRFGDVDFVAKTGWAGL